jgi:hypothetical protein
VICGRPEVSNTQLESTTWCRFTSFGQNSFLGLSHGRDGLIISLYVAGEAEEEVAVQSSTINYDVVSLLVPIGDSESNGIEDGHPRVLRLPRLPRWGNTAKQFRINTGNRSGDLSFGAASKNAKRSFDGLALDEANGNCSALSFRLQRRERMN